MNAFFSQQVIREFVVLTHQYAPEFGRASGGVLNIVTGAARNEPTGAAHSCRGRPATGTSPGEFVSSLPARGEACRTSTAAPGRVQARRPDPQGQGVLLRRLRAPAGATS